MITRRIDKHLRTTKPNPFTQPKIITTAGTKSNAMLVLLLRQIHHLAMLVDGVIRISPELKEVRGTQVDRLEKLRSREWQPHLDPLRCIVRQ